MMRRPVPNPSRPRQDRRAGFTLIELAVVFVIIAVLAAFLLPVLTSAVRTARNSAASAEMQVFSASLEAFRQKYGEYPPSRVMLCEDGIWDTANDDMVPVANGADITYGQLAQRSIEALRKYWPGIPAYTALPAPTQRFTADTTWYDFNGNGRFDPPSTRGRGVILQGTEAWVFFLGGIPLQTGDTGDPQLSLSGFSRGQILYPGGSRMAPAPFRNNLNNVDTTPSNLTYWGDREKPFYEYRAERLADADGNGFPEYLDTYGLDKPIVYFRSDGNGYDPNDCNIPEPDTTGTVPNVARAFRVSFPVQVVAALKNGARTAVSPAPNPYSTNPANTGATTAWHKPQSFQLISAGRDGLFGAGGRYAPSALADKLPVEDAAGNLNTKDTNVRSVEKDNICNFASGTLD